MNRNRNRNDRGILEVLVIAIITAIIIALAALITRAIWNSDMPMWLKIFFLR